MTAMHLSCDSSYLIRTVSSALSQYIILYMVLYRNVVLALWGANVLLLICNLVCMPCSHCYHAAHCTYDCGDTMLIQGALPSSLHYAATPFSVSELLNKHEMEFFEVVNPKFSLLSLEREEVITQDVASRISAVNDDDAKEILFAHLTRYANVNSLVKYCDVIIGGNGFPNMQSFGAKIKEELQQGGLWSCVLVCLPVCI